MFFRFSNGNVHDLLLQRARDNMGMCSDGVCSGSVCGDGCVVMVCGDCVW